MADEFRGHRFDWFPLLIEAAPGGGWGPCCGQPCGVPSGDRGENPEGRYAEQMRKNLCMTMAITEPPRDAAVTGRYSCSFGR